MIRRFTSLSASRILAAAVQAISLIVVARFVEVAVFGELSVIIAVVTFVFVAAAAGLPAFILREHALAERPNLPWFRKAGDARVPRPAEDPLNQAQVQGVVVDNQDAEFGVHIGKDGVHERLNTAPV